MRRGPWIVLALLIPFVIVGGLLAGRAFRDDGGAQNQIAVTRADAAAYEHDDVIPPGTADRIAAGQPVEIVPAELAVKVGEAIRTVNNDSADHVVGVFFVAAGETLTQRFNSEGVLEGECSVHPSGAFTLRVVA